MIKLGNKLFTCEIDKIYCRREVYTFFLRPNDKIRNSINEAVTGISYYVLGKIKALRVVEIGKFPWMEV